MLRPVGGAGAGVAADAIAGTRCPVSAPIHPGEAAVSPLQPSPWGVEDFLRAVR